MARNDPDWNKNNGGPPDLDVLLQRFQRKVSSFFGGKSRGAGPGEGRGKAVGLVIGILAVLWLASGLYVIHEGERGLVLRLGSLQGIALPGTHWRLPYPIDTVRIVDLQRVRIVRIGFLDNTRGSASADALMLTADQNLVNVQVAVQYTVKDAAAWAFGLHRPTETVRAAADMVMRETVGRNTLAALLATNRTPLAEQAAHQLQAVLDREQAGVAVGRVSFMNVQPPQPVQSAYSEIGKNSQEAGKQKSEAQAYAGDIIPKAQADAARMLGDANTYKAQAVAQAQTEAAQFNQAYAGYRQAPQITREQMYLSTMKQIMTQATTIIVDSKSGGSVNLSLDQLMAKAPAKPVPEVSAGGQQTKPPASLSRAPEVVPQTATPSPTAPQPAAPAASDGLREQSLQGLRSRERQERP